MNLSDNESNLNGNVGPLTLKTNLNAMRLTVTGDLGKVIIGGSFLGEGADYRGNLQASGDIASITIGGDLRAGVNHHDSAAGARTGYISSGGDIGSVTIGGSIVGSQANLSGRIYATGTIGNISVKNSIIDEGSVGSNAGIGNFTVGGSLNDGEIYTNGALGSVKITGSVTDSLIQGDIKIGAVTIGGSVTSSQFETSSGSLAGLRIEHDATSVRIDVGTSLGAVSIGGDFTYSRLATASLTSLTVGGSFVGGTTAESGYIQVNGDAGSISIGRDIVGWSENRTGYVFVGGNLKILKIGGDLQGGGANDTGSIRVIGTLSSATILGGIIGGTTATTGSRDDTGSVYVGHLGSLTLGGSLLAGARLDTGTLIRSGAIVADYEIGSLTIKGSVVGDQGNRASIFAYGKAGNPAVNNIAIKSLNIGGRVEKAWIFAGTDAQGAVSGGVGSGNAQIGTVTVGGDWIASSLGAGVSSADGTIGDGDDETVNGETGSKIASIVIKGQVIGAGSETFGFFSHQIGSFKYAGATVKLKTGAGNDLIGPTPLGTSLSASSPNGYAVNLYEV